MRFLLKRQPLEFLTNPHNDNQINSTQMYVTQSCDNMKETFAIQKFQDLTIETFVCSVG